MIGDESMHYKDCRSGELVNGIERSAHRALLYSTGLDEEDLKKPLIAVVNSYTEMVPGHYHLRELVEFVKLGVAEAGGVAREFSTMPIFVAGVFYFVLNWLVSRFFTYMERKLDYYR